VSIAGEEEVYPEYFSLAEEHYKDLLREAAVERLTCRSPHQVHPSERGLYRLGQQLVIWGYRLQAHASLKK
jgi:hypothetical protein